MAEIAEEAFCGFDIATEISGEIIKMNDLLEDLSAGFGAISPPWTAIHVNPVASGEESGMSRCA